MELDKVPGYTRARERGFKIEESFREYSYLDAPEFISGIELRALTLQMYLQLSAARSPFFVGGPVHIQDVAVFLFRLSPAYDEAFAAKKNCRSLIANCEKLSVWRTARIARENGLLPTFSFRHPVSGLRSRRRLSLITLLNKNVERIAHNAFRRARRSFLGNILVLRERDDPHLTRTIRAINRFLDRMLLDKPIVSKGKNLSRDPSDTSSAADIIHLIERAYGGYSRKDILGLPMPEVFQALRNIHRDNPNCPKRARSKVHPFATRFTRKHHAIAIASALAELPPPA